VLLVLLATAVVAVVILVWPDGGQALSPGRASWAMTPGAVNPDVTQGTIAETICRRLGPQFAGRAERLDLGIDASKAEVARRARG